MSRTRRSRRVLTMVGAGVGLTVTAYAAYVGLAWLRYGHTTAGEGDEHDALLDRFMPAYEVAERHHVRVAAPAAITLAAAQEQSLFRSLAVRAIVKVREIAMGATAARQRHAQPLLQEMLALGWGILADVPGREVVVGAVTRPWEADVVFRALPAAQFAEFNEPGYVKIVWTLRADPVDAGTSIFRTETRVTTTDAVARARFRRYWSFASPGIVLIRRLFLSPLKKEAEGRARTRPAAAS